MSETGDDAPIQPHEPVSDTVLARDELVASARPPRVDRWAHRRGEPRLFAFWWATYLLGATLVSFSLLGLRPQATIETYRPAARLLITIAMAGVVMLWPMVRLSQTHPRRARFPESAARSVGKDVIVVLVPLLAVVVPQAWLAEWPIDVTLGLSASVSAWTLLVGAVLLIGLERGRRTSAMVFIVVLALVPSAGIALAPGSPREWAWAIWPLTLPGEFTRDRAWTGSIAAISAAHWWVVAGLWASAGGAWTVAALLSQSRPEHVRSARGYT